MEQLIEEYGISIVFCVIGLAVISALRRMLFGI